jgi:putrescine importer
MNGSGRSQEVFAPDSPPGASTRLKQNVIGPLGLAALAIGITSPAMGLYVQWGSMQAMAGPITPLIFLAAMALTLPTAVSYAALNRSAPSAGAASTWLWKGLSRTAGYQAGVLMATYFTMGVVCCPLMFGLFFADLLQLLRVPLATLPSLCLGIVISTLPIAVSCLRGAEASIKTTVRLMVLETLVVLALSATILVTKAGVPGGISLSPLDPRLATHGVSGFWAAMILGMASFSGFDIVSTAAEEADAPRKHLPRAIMITIIGSGLFWAVNAWVFTLALPADELLRYTQQGLPAVMCVAQAYWGWGSIAIVLTALTAITAVYISAVQGASRILFALARHGLMPAPFARLVGARRVPRNAIVAMLLGAVVTDFVTLYVLRNGVESFNWWASAVVFFATLTFMGVNLANGFYFFRCARSEFTVVKSVVLPLIGFALNGYLLYAAFFSALWSLDMRSGKSIVLACVGVLIVEILVTLGMRLFVPRLFPREAPLGAA